MAFAEFAKLSFSFKCFVEFFDVCVMDVNKSYSLQNMRVLTVFALPGKPIQSFCVVGGTSGEGYSSETACQSSCTGKGMGAFYDQHLLFPSQLGTGKLDIIPPPLHPATKHFFAPK
jgi:hypothetical protein